MANILLIVAGGKYANTTGMSMPLGVLYLASSIRNTGEHTPHIFDMNIENGGIPGALAFAGIFKPDVIGISARTHETSIMHELANKMKNTVPKAKIVVGGPHPSAYAEETMADKAIDVAVIGEGEATFSEMVPLLVSGADYSQIRGIAFIKDGHLVKTEPRSFIEDLDNIPFPAWDLLKLGEYWKLNSFGRLGPRRYMSIFSSRACPYGCIFCHKIFGKKFRARSAENVLDEIEVLVSRYGIREFEFLDDCFNFSRERVLNICDQIIARKLRITLSFPNGLRGDRLDYALLKKMKEAGTREIAVAIETASTRLLKLIGKNLNLDKVKQSIDDARKLSIPCDGFFMLGFPTETEEEMRETIRFAAESNLLYAHFTIVTPFRGTTLAERYRDKVEPTQRDLHSLSFYEGTHHNLSDVPNDTVAMLQKKANREFYFSKGRIIRILWATNQKRRIPLLAAKFMRKKIIGS